MSRERSIGFWALGSFCIFIGCVLAGALIEPGNEITAEVAIGYIMSFLLILVGGMFWISVAISHFE